MEIRGGMDDLKTALGITSGPANGLRPVTADSEKQATALAGDLATVSSAGAVMQQSAAAGGIRSEKVASIQASLATESYQVPAAAVASKVVESMLQGTTGPEG